jgi:hypothetical protein
MNVIASLTRNEGWYWKDGAIILLSRKERKFGYAEPKHCHTEHQPHDITSTICTPVYKREDETHERMHCAHPWWWPNS